MNINFIRNLSDEILRENQQLKTDIILLKQRLADYEQQMASAITLVTTTNLLASPRQMLTSFISTFRQLIRQKEELQSAFSSKSSECKSLRLQKEMVEEQRLCLQSQLALERQKEKQLREQGKNESSRWVQQRQFLRAANDQLSRELIQLKQQLRLQRLMMLQTKRREVEQVRQYHMKEMLDFREKSDKEVVVLERQMQVQLTQKDSTIKDLEKALQKLSHNLKLDDRQSDILVRLLKSFQEYNHLSRIIQQRSQQLSRFRLQIQELDLARIKAQSKLKQVTTSQHNLHSQMERLAFQKRDLEDKLEAQKKSLEKSEQDKDAMEKYYDHKWNKEYSNVKQQLEKIFNQKINNKDKECKEKLSALQKIVQKAEQKLALTLQRNDELEIEMKQMTNQNTKILNNNEEILICLAEIKREKRQVEAMTKQQLAQTIVAYSLAATCYQNQINNLNSLISLQKEIYDDLQAKHKQEIEQAEQANKKKMDKFITEKERQKKMLQHNHEKELKAAQRELQAKERFIEDVRANLTREIQEEYVRRGQATQRELEAKSREKQEELSKRNDKWMIKFKEVDLKYTNFKKRTEDEQELYRKQISRLEGENKALRQSQGKLHAEVKQGMVSRNQLVMRIGQGERKIAQLSLLLQQSIEQKAKLEKAIQSKRKEIDLLAQSRQSWLGEISDVQKAYKLQFQSLKRTHDKQINLLKSRVWELEEVARKRPIKRKDYERLQEMDKERKQLRNEVYIKQAQNIILNQVKDYYQTKLREEEKPAEESSRVGAALMGFKLKMLKKSTNKQSFTFNQLEQTKQVAEMRKYIVKSTKRSMKLSLSKFKCEDMSRYHRMNTTHQ